MMKRTIIAIALLSVINSANALKTPARGDADFRVRTAEYHENQVYKITGFFGFPTTVSLNNDEAIVKLVGFDLGWNIENVADNKVVIQPRVENADANLTVITTKRIYYFDLNVRPFPKETYKSQAQDRDQTFGLRFTYPEDEAAQAALKIQAGEVRAKLQAAKDALSSIQEAQARKLKDAKNASSKRLKNYDYSYMGSEVIKPYEVWDDGTFTYFKFYAQQDLPTVFVVNEDATESIVNKFVDGDAGDVMVVQRVAKQFVLRLGGTITCIYNDNPEVFSPSSPTATSSEQIQRIIKGENQ
ncbi:TrbG/VirB9 family P-type conjugative transfer protein [Sulfurirhabdus autotrophica]|uniref:Type IV secretion system protein VirB9 n=1 Tax=Sulfurirhabdus autotrophica TaxID=1706046 RepID=A0A4R3XUU4_9PROT|nr:TrbG/VirB9 family P-type conjugative transfer protein [Sulfurirhabdus autotrophica]TCV82732.1 type IV secretion system protein VirB9 [Sulfurirhabdus autotrophica]